MGLEFSVNKELASISVTLTELAAVVGILRRQLPNTSFQTQLSQLVRPLFECYAVIADNLAPWRELLDEAVFQRDFEARHEAYQANFLKEASKPRIFCEQAYEQYQLLKSCKEVKTSYPLLKRNFTRLDEYLDKWIDNDTWLVMSMDLMFKMLNRLLQEIAEFKRKDAEDAYLVYASAFADFAVYLGVIEEKLEGLR